MPAVSQPRPASPRHSQQLRRSQRKAQPADGLSVRSWPSGFNPRSRLVHSAEFRGTRSISFDTSFEAGVSHAAFRRRSNDLGSHPESVDPERFRSNAREPGGYRNSDAMRSAGNGFSEYKVTSHAESDLCVVQRKE